MSMCDILNDSRCYTDPAKFDPERWLRPDSDQSYRRHFVPFSRGSRNCLGMKFVFHRGVGPQDISNTDHFTVLHMQSST